jgi:hypothetical protein
MRGGLLVAEMLVRAERGGNPDEVLTRAMAKQRGGDGSVTLLKPDGSEYPGSPFKGGGLPGPRAATIDGDDNVWVSNFAMPNAHRVESTSSGTPKQLSISCQLFMTHVGEAIAHRGFSVSGHS